MLRLDGAGIADMHLGVTIEFGTRTRGSGFILPQNDGRGGLRVVVAGTCGRAARGVGWYVRAGGRAGRGGLRVVGLRVVGLRRWGLTVMWLRRGSDHEGGSPAVHCTSSSSAA